MKRIASICALLLLLSSCQKLGIVSNDSSPIIIADGGSVHLNQPDHFRVHGEHKASVRLGNHMPTFLGYECDPNAGTCTSECKAPAKPQCSINLTKLTQWTLDISDGDTVATLSWDSSKNKEKIVLDFPKGYTVKDGPDSTVDLVPSTKHLQSATFKGVGDPVSFACPTNDRCLWVQYYCGSGCTQP